MTIPNLEPHCGSWIIVNPKTGDAIQETFIRRTAEEADRLGYEVLTALQWLDRLNKRNFTHG